MDTISILNFVADLQARLSKLSFENERLLDKNRELAEENESLLIKIQVKEEIIAEYDSRIKAERGSDTDEDGDANMH